MSYHSICISYSKNKNGNYRFLVYVFIFTISLISAYNPAFSEEISKDIDRCKTLGFWKKTELAIEACTRIIKSGRLNEERKGKITLSKAYTLRGEAYSTEKEYEKAVSDFSTAILLIGNFLKAPEYKLFAKNKEHKINDDLQMLYKMRGKAYRDMGKHSEAIADFDTITKKFPKEYDPYELRSKIYLQIGAHDKAFREYDRFINKSPRKADGYLYKSWAQEKAGRSKDAISSLSKAIKIKPVDEKYHLERGKLYSKLRKYNLAITDFGTVISLKEKYGGRNYVEALQLRFAALYATNSKKAAYKDLNKVTSVLEFYKREAEKIDKDSWYNQYSWHKDKAYINHRIRGHIFTSGGDFGNAVKEYERMVRLFPKKVEGHANLVKAALGAKMWDRGLEATKRLEDLAPDKKLEIIFSRGKLNYGKGNYSQAIADFSKVISLKPNNTQAYKERARAYAKSGDPDRARADNAKAKEIVQRIIEKATKK